MVERADKWELWSESMFGEAGLTTPDGRPVSGFDDGRGQPVQQSEWEQQQARIAELERERDEALQVNARLYRRAEDLQDTLRIITGDGSLWVRLDNETIERVSLDGPAYGIGPERLTLLLRHLRERKLGGDDD